MKKSITILVVLLLFFAIFAFVQRAALASTPETSDEGPNYATSTLFTETFEGAFPGSAWYTGDSNSANGLDYWDDTTYIKHAGSWGGWCAQSGMQSTPQTIWTENFEGAFPGTSWYVTDWNSANGYDYWDDTTYIKHAGSWGGWCAQVGSKPSTTVTIFTETFEGAFPGSAWYTGDWNSASGLDYWDDTSYIKHSGGWGGWCAQVGTQLIAIPNSVLHQYDNDMNAYMYRYVGSLTSYTSVSLSYWWALNSESGFDYLQVMYWAGGAWHYVDTHTGNLWSWHYSTVTIPTTATYVGFRFYSDYSNKAPGAYIDDISLTGTRQVPNANDHMYDDNMDAVMYRYASLSGYASVTLSYWWALNCESSLDYLQVMYWAGGAWHYLDTHTGNLWSWHYSTVTIPTTATYVGFRFHSDSSIHYQGAYIDDIVLSGYASNSAVHQYDDNMDAYMYRYVGSLTSYTSVSLSYWWALNCESSLDYLQVMYWAGGAWHYLDTHTGNLWSWHYSTVTIPTTATYVGFRFHSDSSIHYQGAYIDDIVCTGTTPTPTLLFSSGFEAGSFSGWTGTAATTGETRAVTSALKHLGTYSARFTSNGGGGTEYSYCYKTITSSSELYARAYFRVSQSGIVQTTDNFYLIALRTASMTVAYAGWRPNPATGLLRWSLVIKQGTTSLVAYSATAPSLNTWYSVEIRWKNHATSGLGQLWINGVLVCSISGANTAANGNVNQVRFGLPFIINCGSTTAYCDDVRVKTGYIGP